jgi:DNA modification methylase
MVGRTKKAKVQAHDFDLVDAGTGEIVEFRGGAPALPGRVSRTGLELEEGLAFEAWEAIGATLQKCEESIQWWRGDWLRYGERSYGETYAQAIDAANASYQTLANEKYVAEHVELSRRRENLSWSHHSEVAALDPREQDAWLDAAQAQGWSQKELRQQIKATRREAELAEHTRVSTTGQIDLTEGDACVYLATVKAASVDLLLTDPPYMTDVDDIAAFARAWVPLALDALKPTGRAYIFTGAYPREMAAYLEVLQAEADDRGWTLSDVLVWTYRNTIGPAPNMGYKLNWQACFYLYGPDAPALSCPILVERFSVQDINAPDARTGVRFHAWQKPDEIGERFIRHATKAGDLVLDPFVGTGTFVSAAARLGRNAIGCDRDPEMIDLCRRRGLEVAHAA